MRTAAYRGGVGDALRPFRDPASVAVVGASEDPVKWGFWLARGALTGSHRRDVYLVNERSSKVQGQRAHPSLRDLPSVPELVVLSVPPERANAVVREALELGVRAFLGITAGIDDEQELRRMLAAAGARMVGPNSLGLFDAEHELQLAWGRFTAGSLAVVSQSGQLGSEIALLGSRAGLGISRFVSVGNQVDVTAADLLDDLVDDARTTTIALYLESFADGERLVRTLQDLRRAGKTTIVLTTGASEGSKRLARSHTGSLTSATDAVDAACRAGGAVRVATPAELVDLARYVSTAPLPQGRRIAVVSDSGGQAGIAADMATSHGLWVLPLPEEVQASLASVLPPAASSSNPIDLAGAGERNLDVYAELSGRLLESGAVDGVVLSGYLGCYGDDAEAVREHELRVVDRLGELVARTGVPLVVHSMSADSQAVSRMGERGVPAYIRIESALKATAEAATLGTQSGRPISRPVPADSRVDGGYWAARNLVQTIGVDVPAGVLVQEPGDLIRAMNELRAPYVLKAGWIEHKTEAGGLALGLRDGTALANAYEEMRKRLGDGDFVVEEQDPRPHVVELLIGAHHDPGFGPLIVVGMGGTETELRRDTCVELAPVDRATAVAMLGRLHGAPLLAGWRGRPPVDLESVADAVVAVSRVINENSALGTLELNPVRVDETGALAVDALALPISRTSTAIEGEGRTS
ncbi:MAG: acetate--CoA ligase family protein [Nocardioidaceae bacterium]